MLTIEMRVLTRAVDSEKRLRAGCELLTTSPLVARW